MLERKASNIYEGPHKGAGNYMGEKEGDCEGPQLDSVLKEGYVEQEARNILFASKFHYCVT